MPKAHFSSLVHGDFVRCFAKRQTTIIRTPFPHHQDKRELVPGQSFDAWYENFRNGKLCVSSYWQNSFPADYWFICPDDFEFEMLKPNRPEPYGAR